MEAVTDTGASTEAAVGGVLGKGPQKPAPPAHECDLREKSQSTFMIRTPEPEHSMKPNIHSNLEGSSRRLTVSRAQAGRMFVSGPLSEHLPTTVTSLSL